MSERIVDLVVKRASKDHELRLKTVQTEKLPLTKNPFKNYAEVKSYVKSILPAWQAFGFSETDIKSLVHRYGRQTDHILKKFREFPEEDAVLRLAKAELWYGIHFEMVLKPLDFFERRTGRLYFDPFELDQLKDPILKEFANYFNWDAPTFTSENKVLEKAFKGIREFQ